MWWDIIPSGAVMTACFVLPSILVYGIHMVFLRNPYQRTIVTERDIYHYLRDMRISKSEDAYKQVGLESLGSDD